LLSPGRLASRDHPDLVFIGTDRMSDDQEPDLPAHSEKEESIFGVRVVRVVEQKGHLVGEDRLRFLESDAVLAAVLGGLSRIPCESKVTHLASILTM